ncbi:hypothetical protein [Streptomyces chartreusis]|uniref:Uncharacterized protein n=1 Tax=Streptomyces chartreusis TaxID=1969 RepID=A0A7H8TB40_STRCX|nr:hypothetical protein [Streptomyces chartreusis]QKZ20574.1 hypothetical protein HUT05_26465 [Streptomyces chartreusis]
MTDDRELGEDVLEVLLPLLKACTALQASEPTRLSHRGGGLRVVLDVQLADGPTVRVERVNEPAGSRSTARGGTPARRQRRRSALPPGG